jgi:1-aminocyclopropane-1-carboxylate deaminase/D-cysteine desulfhydrase-like pyridoxal-dependent ACC family enzyme
MSILNDTPIEVYQIGKRDIYVKREDLCAPTGWPPFSKIRGLWAYLSRRKAEGLHTVGYVETSISMAGWGVCCAAVELGIKPVIFDPQFTTVRPEHKLLDYHRKQWNSFESADIIGIPAGRAKVNWYQARATLATRYGTKGVELLPLGIPLEETVMEAAHQYDIACVEMISLTGRLPGTTICCVGSGTIFAGLLQAHAKVNPRGRLIGVMCRKGNKEQKLAQCYKKAGVMRGGLLGGWDFASIVDQGWQYTEPSTLPCPFPCHPYYDLKAWQYLGSGTYYAPEPILFWNIGQSPIPA